MGRGAAGQCDVSTDDNPGCAPPTDALQSYTGGNLTVTGPKETASIFATYPAAYLTLRGGFVDQVGCMCVGDRHLCLCRLGPQPIVRALGGLGYGVGAIFTPLLTPAACVRQSRVTRGGDLGCLREGGWNISKLMGAPLPVTSKVLGTCVLIVGALAIMDSRNKKVPESLQPVVIGLLILTVELSMGSNCGVPLNPARDLGPRLFTYIAGWGPEVFRWEMASPGAHLPLLALSLGPQLSPFKQSPWPLRTARFL